MPCLLLPSQEYRFYPVMPDRANRDSTRAFSGGFDVGLRKRSSVRYSRRSYRQTTESAELCSPIGCSLRQTRPHYSSIKETSLASGEAASDVYNHTTVVPVMNGHPRDQSKVSVHCRWPLVTGTDGQAEYAK